MKNVPVVEAGLDMHVNIHTKNLTHVDVPKLHSCFINTACYGEEHYLLSRQVLASQKCQQVLF